jgi:hypothetical protein
MNQWVFSLVTDKLTVTMQIAKRVFLLAQNQNDPALTTIEQPEANFEELLETGLLLPA